MSASQPVKSILSVNINEETAPNHDLLLTWASSIPTDRLQPYEEWIRAERPTGQYAGHKPIYQLRLDWTQMKEGGPVQVVNRALELCFGARGMPGWGIWIREDQLNLLMREIRLLYGKEVAKKFAELGLLDLWIEDLLKELKRM